MEELDPELAQFSILLPGFRALVDVLEKRANLIHVREALVQFTMCIAWAICRTTIPQVPELAFLKKYLVTTGIAFLDTAEDDVSTTASSDVMVLGANNDRQSSNAHPGLLESSQQSAHAHAPATMLPKPVVLGVNVPDGKLPGDTFVAQAPNGTCATITVPEGAQAGQVLSVQMYPESYAGSSPSPSIASNLSEELREVASLSTHQVERSTFIVPPRGKVCSGLGLRLWLGLGRKRESWSGAGAVASVGPGPGLALSLVLALTLALVLALGLGG